jgi:hypothetical protein
VVDDGFLDFDRFKDGLLPGDDFGIAGHGLQVGGIATGQALAASGQRKGEMDVFIGSNFSASGAGDMHPTPPIRMGTVMLAEFVKQYGSVHDG